MKNIYTSIIFLIISLIFSHSVFASSQRKKTVRKKKIRIAILGGKKGDNYYSFASDLKKNLKSDFYLNVKRSNGVSDNYKKMLNKRKLYLSFFPENFLYSKYQDDYENAKQFEVVLPMGKEPICLIVGRYSEINNLSDLSKKKIKFKDIFRSGISNVFKNMKQYITSNYYKVVIGNKEQRINFTAKRIRKLVNGKWEEHEIDIRRTVTDLVKERSKYDAVFIMGAEPLSILRKLTIVKRNQIKLIPLENENLTKAGEEEKLMPYTIKANTYSWANYDVNTYAINTYLVMSNFNKTLQEKREVKRLVKMIAEKYYIIKKKGHPAWKNLNFEFNETPFPVMETNQFFYFYSYNSETIEETPCEKILFLSNLVNAKPSEMDSLKMVFAEKIKSKYCRNWEEEVKISASSILERKVENFKYETLNDFYKSRNREIYSDVPVNL